MSFGHRSKNKLLTGELCDTIFIRRPSTTEPGLLWLCSRKRGKKTVAFTSYLRFFVFKLDRWFRMPGVMTGGVGVPDVDKDIGNRFASVHVDDADIKVSEQTYLIFSNVLTNRVASQVIVWSFGNNGSWGVVSKDKLGQKTVIYLGHRCCCLHARHLQLGNTP